MVLSPFDWILFLAFFAAVIGFSLFKSRGGAEAEEDYFLAGRGLPWWLIGISIVAANISTEQFVGMAGQGAGAVGLAVSWWQLIGSVGIVLIAFTLLPRFLKAGIYTMPEYLEYRYNVYARSIFAILTVAIYVVVLLTAVLFSGGLTLHTIFDLDLSLAVWVIGGAAAFYTAIGGLKAVAYADLIQGLALLVGGLLVFALGLDACGGWGEFSAANEDKLHMVLPASDENLPWTGVLGGMWIVLIYYCGLNQFIVQRNLAARTLKDGQLGMIFAGGLWLLVPFAIVMPGIMAFQLFPGELAETPDKAYPTLIANLLPSGMRGFLLAALAGAITSSLASMLNSASTIFTLDVVQRLIRKDARQSQMVWLGRIMVIVFVVIGCLLAPMLADPKFGGVFQFIQQFQGYIWPGVVAAFLFGMLVPKAPPAAGVLALVAGPMLYGILQAFATDIHFLLQVLIAFVAVCALMALVTTLSPMPEAKVLPERKDLDLETDPKVKLLGAAVILSVVVFVVVFW
ncbi:solute:sodium symporter family transporter [Coraliomargarita sinensis]|uniref:Solute:sodium symporter family transporter n=1 Tax=Coraliomargarita sinensis TaxID=2174842 RepID=A0A317ZK18_9BACT|nr:sodium/solute symporter [Coraliomargarita sinensis]PXA04288.1 solute:sodium symporter family transporter [Coraliomargarita sinensis]